MINLDTKKVYTKEEILKRAEEGKFINTDGIPFDLDGKGMREFLESIGFEVTKNYDAGTNAWIICLYDGIKVSSNGYCCRIS